MGGDVPLMLLLFHAVYCEGTQGGEGKGYWCGCGGDGGGSK